MKNIATVLVFSSVLIGAHARCDEPLEVVEFTDPNWAFPAYFRLAAQADAVEMKHGLAAGCKELSDKWGTTEPYEEIWLCQNGPMYFYTGVDGWGKKTKSGYVCEQHLGLPKQRYFGDSRFTEFKCQFLWWDK